MIENESSFCMHYESEDVDLVLLSGVFQDANIIDETNRNDISILPH